MSSLRIYGQSPLPEPASPLTTHYTHFSLNGAVGTAIGRTWKVKDRVTCGGLCATGCNFDAGHCQIGVNVHVPPELCPDFKRT